jgi:hypothetical protein
MAQFNRYIGIDYSGAETADSSCKGLRVFMAEGSNEPTQILLPSGQKKYWTRRGLAEWLCDRLADHIPTLVGIDHGFSFPLEYFDRHSLPRDWPSFLLDFQKHWPTHEPHMYIDFIRHGKFGEGQKRMGESNWLRLTERWTATAKSVFLFDVQGSVAKSTFAGLPWLLYLRNWCKRPIHFWPFDGWEIPSGASVVTEVYPALWTRRLSKDGRDGSLGSYFNPPLTPDERQVADIEGWILGVV